MISLYRRGFGGKFGLEFIEGDHEAIPFGDNIERIVRGAVGPTKTTFVGRSLFRRAQSDRESRLAGGEIHRSKTA